MPIRPRNDVPRLSGRPGAAPERATRDNQTVFRRFFDLIERLDKPGPPPAAPGTKARTPDGRGGRS